ncbi:MAG: 50S ribosomal protein L23 [Candidatus Eisenbacteria bacterium]|nr:50S ribosomal protein L23 [Candidatus Latescibacterota bacterium]MBD3302757.1 50S ribosomal protein L23 [Candidatus Eisenbacteria bacterium]
MIKDPRSIVLRALMTEKGAVLREQRNTYLFKVSPKANKIEIRRAIAELFKVEVEDVRTINVQGKFKRLGRTAGRRASWKKAIVTIKEGQTIDLFDQV